jgi:sensor histidine kinase YesM
MRQFRIPAARTLPHWRFRPAVCPATGRRSAPFCAGKEKIMQQKKRWPKIKNSVSLKSLTLMICLSTFVLLGIEGLSYLYLHSYKEATVSNYTASLQMYYSYWDNKMDVIDNSLLALANANNGLDNNYDTVCNAADGLDFETGKTMLAARLTSIAWSHENYIQTFVYVPQRKMLLKSSNQLLTYDRREAVMEDLLRFLNKGFPGNSTHWNYLRSGNDVFLVHAYAVNNGYIGAILKCDTLLEKGDSFVHLGEDLQLLDQAGAVVYPLAQPAEKTNDKQTEFFIPMENLDGQIRVRVKSQNLSGDGKMFTLLSLGTVLLGLVLLAWNLRFQVKYVLRPLNILRSGMETFSRGKLDVHLDENSPDSEIQTLYSTFNAMVEQIAHLKIDVYESRLAQEKIESNYMRVQIQPHFYTNILNLIYGLAQIGDYESIQKLAMTTGTYFRYLLGEKGTLVPLKEEIACVRNYVEIQQLRYQDELTFALSVESGLEDQPVLPLILQTFAENCIKHNITLVPVLHVEIRIAAQGGQIRFAVVDNGVGFAPQTLEKLDHDEALSENGHHIGITNVKERLKLFYGDAASVSILSRPGRTEVDVLLPMAKKPDAGGPALPEEGEKT